MWKSTTNTCPIWMLLSSALTQQCLLDITATMHTTTKRWERRQSPDPLTNHLRLGRRGRRQSLQRNGPRWPSIRLGAMDHDVIQSAGAGLFVCLFVCLVFNGTFSTYRLYRAIGVWLYDNLVHSGKSAAHAQLTSSDVGDMSVKLTVHTFVVANTNCLTDWNCAYLEVSKVPDRMC